MAAHNTISILNTNPHSLSKQGSQYLECDKEDPASIRAELMPECDEHDHVYVHAGAPDLAHSGILIAPANVFDADAYIFDDCEIDACGKAVDFTGTRTTAVVEFWSR